MKKIEPLSKLEFWQILQAFKCEPKYVTKEEFKEIKKDKEFIRLIRYSGGFALIMDNEVGILDFNRLVLKK